MRPLTIAALALVATASSSGAARAAPCGRPDLLEAMPPEAATAVPTDAKLHAHYAPGTEYLGEAISLEHVGHEAASLTGTFDEAEEMLTVAPPNGLVAGDDYVVHWPALRGLTTASLGRGADVRFTAGDGPDEGPPAFAGLVGLEWDLDRSKDTCTDSLENRYAFDLALAPADDDGGGGSLTLLLFQTKGPTIAAGSPEQVLVTSMPTGGTVRVSRAPDDTTGDVCFAAIARDLVGNVSASGSREVCTTTVAMPFFAGCSVGPSAPASGGALVALAAAAALARRASSGSRRRRRVRRA